MRLVVPKQKLAYNPVNRRERYLVRRVLPLVFCAIRVHGRRSDHITALAAYIHALKDSRAVLYVVAGVLEIQVIASAPRDALHRVRECSVYPFPCADFFIAI